MKPLMKYHVSIQTQDGRKINTWGVFPVSNTTKILDGIYDPDQKVLSLLFDSVSEQYVDVQVPKANGKWEVQQRKLDQYYKFKLPTDDLEFFMNSYVDNNFEIEASIETPSTIITAQ